MKKKKRRKIRINRLITVLLFVFMFCFGTIVFIKSDFFSLKNIKIVDNDILTKSEVYDLSKITTGKNLFTYNLEKIKSNIEDSPYIKDVIVKRHIPNSIIINIDEKPVKYALKDEDDNYYYIDEDMEYIDKVEKEKIKKDCTIVEVYFSIKDNKISFEEKKDKEILTLLIDNIKKDGLDNKISTITFLENKEVSMKTKEGIKIIMDKGKNIKNDMVKLTQILIDLKNQNINYGKIDMTFSKYVLYTYK